MTGRIELHFSGLWVYRCCLACEPDIVLEVDVHCGNYFNEVM
jgi:hypothetical protein